MQVWRLARRAFCATAPDAFSGIGPELQGGRWNAQGTRAVYAAETQSLAVLEVLVHIAREQAPDDYVFTRAIIPDAAIAPAPAMPAGWRTPEPHALMVRIGQQFLDANGGLAMRVPSVVIPAEFIVLINPKHPAFSTIGIDPALAPLYFDEPEIPGATDFVAQSGVCEANVVEGRCGGGTSTAALRASAQ